MRCTSFVAFTFKWSINWTDWHLQSNENLYGVYAVRFRLYATCPISAHTDESNCLFNHLIFTRDLHMLVTLVISKHNYYFSVLFILFFSFSQLAFCCNVSDVNLSFDWLNVQCAHWSVCAHSITWYINTKQNEKKKLGENHVKCHWAVSVSPFVYGLCVWSRPKAHWHLKLFCHEIEHFTRHNYW